MDLFIDTHLNDVVIILHKKGKLVKEKIITNVTQTSNVVMPTIKKVLGNGKPKSIIVVNGPGSFTGVRLGVTIAKTFAETLNIPIRVVSSLECMAISINSDSKIVAFSDKNGYYVGIFDSFNNLVGNYEYLSNEEYKKYTSKYNVYENISLDYLKIIEFALNKETLNPHKVNPIYIKLIDALK